MGDTLRLACVQLSAGADKAANLATAERLVTQAASGGAELVVLPEKWNGLTEDAVARAALAEPLDGGESVEAMASWARTLGVALVGGSITERREGHDRFSNTSCAFDADGRLVGAYRKIHLFDVEVGGRVYRESAAEEPGDEPVLVELAGWTVGLTVCYDVRFPELYRLLALDGAEVVTVPANFTAFTGRDHWHVLLRARAIENQCFVAASAQWGEPVRGRPSYGHSLVCDPWGTMLAEAPEGDGVVFAELERERLLEIRERLPSLANRQPGAYRKPTLA